MFKRALIMSALVSVAAPAQASCVIFPCKIKEDPIVEFVPVPPPATPSGCIYRAASSSQNLCPAGLQPVQAGGMVSCGVPIAGELCEAPTRVEKVKKTRIVCPVSEKGCYTTN